MYYEIGGKVATIELTQGQCAMLAYALNSMSDQEARGCMGDLAPDLKGALAGAFSLMASSLQEAQPEPAAELAALGAGELEPCGND